MWRTDRLVLVMVAAIPLVACSRNEPRLQGVLLWEGTQSCVSCRAVALDLTTRAEEPLRMKVATDYTIEVRTDADAIPDRCIYRIVNASWIRNDLPREFNCFSVERVMIRPFTTPAAQDASGGARLTVAVNLYDSVERRKLATLFERTYPVEWVQ